jgi:serine/threonine protein kinase
VLRLDDEVGGRYRLLARAGSGGMATVYRAQDERLRREVAVKVIAEHLARPFVSRFRREAQLGARLAHPNVVGVLDAGEEPRDFIAWSSSTGSAPARSLRRGGHSPRLTSSASSPAPAMRLPMRTTGTWCTATSRPATS